MNEDNYAYPRCKHTAEARQRTREYILAAEDAFGVTLLPFVSCSLS